MRAVIDKIHFERKKNRKKGRNNTPLSRIFCLNEKKEVAKRTFFSIRKDATFKKDDIILIVYMLVLLEQTKNKSNETYTRVPFSVAFIVRYSEGNSW